MVKVIHCDLELSEFESYSRYYVLFQTNSHEKDMNFFIPSSYELNSTTTSIHRRWLWH